MLQLKLSERMAEKAINTRQLSEMTGIRWNTVDDMAKNKAKHWSPDNLEKIMRALEIDQVDELIKYVAE